MNKIKLIEMMKQLILLQKKGLLTKEGYEKIEKNTLTLPINDDLLSYKETSLICFLFQEIPYYQILRFISELCMNLAEIEQEIGKNYTAISLILAYFSDLSQNINARVETEITVHIALLLQKFYQNNSLETESTIHILTNNCCNPESLTGMPIAQNGTYEQETLSGFIDKKEALRETISRSNYNRRYSIDNSTQKLIVKFFDEKTFEEFLKALNKCFNEFARVNPIDCEILKSDILLKEKELYQKAQKTWQKNSEKKKEENSYQYSLFS